MGEGRGKTDTRRCHSYEVAVDNGLLVAGQVMPVPCGQSRGVAADRSGTKLERWGEPWMPIAAGYRRTLRVVAGSRRLPPRSAHRCDLHRGHPIGTTRQKIAEFGAEMTYDPGGKSLHLSPRECWSTTKRCKTRVSRCRVCRPRSRVPVARCVRYGCRARYRLLSVGIHKSGIASPSPALLQVASAALPSAGTCGGNGVQLFTKAILGFGRWMHA